MELKDTVSMMCSSDYKERFKAEYFQLKNRLDGLKDMIKKYHNGTLSFEIRSTIWLYESQRYYMEGYFEALKERAKNEGIDLEEGENNNG